MLTITIKGQSRTQAALFPEVIDDFVTDEHPVRVIDAFVDSVDLALLGLEELTHRNVELMWLLERLTPNFKTIANFRKDNSTGIKNMCRQFIPPCVK